LVAGPRAQVAPGAGGDTIQVGAREGASGVTAESQALGSRRPHPPPPPPPRPPGGPPAPRGGPAPAAGGACCHGSARGWVRVPMATGGLGAEAFNCVLQHRPYSSVAPEESLGILGKAPPPWS
jgi:hypothetical protein